MKVCIKTGSPAASLPLLGLSGNLATTVKWSIGDTIYTIKYTLAKVKIIYNLMNNV